MYSLDLNQPGPSRQNYNNNYTSYGDREQFGRSTAADRLRQSNRGARNYNANNFQHNPNMTNYPHTQWPHNTMQQTNPKYQNQQKDRNTNRRSHQQNRRNRAANTSSSHSNTNQRSEDINYRIYRCPNCSSQYDCINRSNVFVGKVPLVLKCKHTVCQECIPKMAKDNAVCCPICKNLSVMPQRYSPEILQANFSPNFFLIGFIMWCKTQGWNPNFMTLVPVQGTGKSRSPIPPVSEQQQTGETCCFLACNKRATLKCPDCSDVYCSDCCTKIHKSAKSLWSHKQIPLENSIKKATLELDRCSEHNMDIEFYCTVCESDACCYCFLEKHQGHTQENLTKLNEIEMEEFQTNKEKAKKTLKQLLITQKRLKELRTCSTKNIQNQISNYLANLHAKLQCVEGNLQKELINYETEGALFTDVNDLNGIVEASVKELKNITAACDVVNIKKMNLKEIAKSLKKVQNVPCYLISENIKELDPLTFEVEPVVDNIEESFKIKKNENGMYKLVSEEDLPSDYEKDCTDLLYDGDTESSNSSLNKAASVDDSQGNRQAHKHTSGKLENELVEVTHIESLDCFYVQMKKTQYQFSQMNTDIENYVKFGAPMADHPQLNEVYLVLYQTRNEKIWCRGRVMEIKNGEMEPLYEVFFVDYGSTQTVDASKLRQIMPDLARKRPFAIHCALYNPSNASWSKNAHVYMGKMINGKQVSMLVKGICNRVHEVDLMVVSSDRGHTSIIDILIHTCSNALSHNENNEPSQKLSYNREHKIFANNMEFRKYQQEKVILVNVIDPHHIFIQIASHAESLKKMNNNLRQTYKNSKKNTCLPIEGTHVIVDYKDNIKGNWHRGFIKKVDITTEKCDVLLIDWGLNVTVDWSSIRMIQEEFTRLESQAILVKLAHIAPIEKGVAWSNAAAVFIQKYCRSQETMKMIVHDVDPLEIALFEVVGDVDICINTQLVLENFAVSTGKISQTLEWPRNDAEIKNFGEDDDDDSLVAMLLKKVDESVEDSENEDDPDVIKQKIEIVKFVDPSLIYIKFCMNEQQEITLSKELQIHYSKERKTKDAWEVGEFCVVLYNFSYVRGKILAKINDKKYKVNVYDRATDVEISLNKIFEFTKYFSKYPNVVFKAHLANIRSAGGDKWSLSSVEVLERLFEKYKEIYATKVEGDTTGKSIPMQMWYTQIKVGGALEASKIIFVSLNHLLVKLGFAYRVQTDSAKSSEKDRLLSAIEKAANVSATSDAGSEQEPVEEEKKVDDVQDSSSKTDDDPSSSIKIESESSITDWNELIEEEEKMKKHKSDENSFYIDDWIQPFSIKGTEFYAWITCAETDGILYLRTEKLQNVYKEMEQNIKEFFDKEPFMTPDDDWVPGQLCTIRHNDFYYRGKVYKVNNPDDITVVMIDFGSDHKVTSKDLIRKILYPRIPAFASKIKLYKVYPKSGAWLDSDYQTLLDVVTEYCKIIIKGSPDEEIPTAEIFTDKGVNVNQYLVQACPNLRRSEPKEDEESDDDRVVIEEEEEVVVESDDDTIETGSTVDTTKYTYKVLPLYKEDDSDKKVAVSIMFVLDYNKVALKETATLTDEFFELGEKMQKAVKHQPVIEKLEEGMPCVCQFSEDMVWYRAQIYNMEGSDCGYVFVFFVDFGNIESVPVTDIKMMRPEWFDLPVSCHIANVNFHLVSDKNIQHVTQFMKKLYGKNKFAQLVSEEPLCVDLFDLDGELYYKCLFDKGLIETK